jgi:uncharacterized Tic20 family protein
MTTGANSGAVLISRPLRSGGTLSLWADRIEADGVAYPLSDLAWAGLVNDPATPPGALPAPSVAWRLADGRYIAATPADPTHAWQILEALFAQRTDLRTPLPPAPPAGQPGWGAAPPPPQYGYAPGYSGYGGYAYAPQPQSNNNETIMAGLSHLSILFGALIVPLILWMINRQTAPYAAQQSKQAFYFHVAVFVVEVLLILAMFGVFAASAATFTATYPVDPTTPPNPAAPFGFLGGIFLFEAAVFAVQAVAIILGIVGAVKAFQGKPFHYPLMGWV